MLTSHNLRRLAKNVNQFFERLDRYFEPYSPHIRAFFQLSEAEQIRILAEGFIQSQEREYRERDAQIQSDRRAMYKAWNRLNN